MATRAMPPFKPWTGISERSLTFRPTNLRGQMIYQGAYGSLMNVWDSAIEDFGPDGVDGGKCGKFVLLPLNWKRDMPIGYSPLRSSSYEFRV